MVSTVRQVFPVVDVYPDPWEPDDYPTRNIFIVATARPFQAGVGQGINAFTQAMLRARPVEVGAGRVLTDEAAPLDPLVRRTTHILRYRVREYLPVGLLLQ